MNSHNTKNKMNRTVFRYCTIIFLQGEEANEALDILDSKGPQAAVNYLAQWDMGGESEHSPVKGGEWGRDDQLVKFPDGYVLSYNLGLNYISLSRRVRKPEGKDLDSDNALATAIALSTIQP